MGAWTEDFHLILSCCFYVSEILTHGETCSVLHCRGPPDGGCNVLVCQRSIWVASRLNSVDFLFSLECVYLLGSLPLSVLMCRQLQCASDVCRLLCLTGWLGLSVGSASVKVAASTCLPWHPRHPSWHPS